MKKQLVQKCMGLSLTAILAAGMLAGCGGGGKDTGAVSGSLPAKAASEAAGEAAEEEAGDGEITVCYPQEAGTFSPANYDTQMYVQNWLFEGLTAWENNEVVPSLAESWDVSEDGKTYTFHIRQGVVFTDGTPFDAHVAEEQLKLMLSHKDRHDWMEMVNQIDTVTAEDDFTLKMTLKNAYYPLLQELSLCRPTRFCSPKAYASTKDPAEGVDEAVGTGPWKLVEHKEGEYCVYERNEEYWGKKPGVKKVTVQVIPDANTAVNAMKAGELDMIYDISGFLTPDAFQELKGAGFMADQSGPTANLDLAVNSNKGATKDLAVRQALEYGIDKDLIVKNVFYDMVEKADFIFDTSLPYCDTDATVYSFDQEKAKSLLKEAGWQDGDGDGFAEKDGEKCSVEYVYLAEDNVAKNLGEVLQSMYAEIGIEIVLSGLEEDAFYASQKDGAFGLIVSETWGSQYDPHSMVSSYREPAHADYAAQSGLSNKAQMDQMISQVMIEEDETKRQEIYGSIFTTLMDQAIYIPVCSKTNVVVYSDRLTDVSTGGMYQMDLISTRLNK